MAAEDLQNEPFPRVFRGYDPDVVDRTINELQAQVTRLEGAIRHGDAHVRKLEGKLQAQAAEVEFLRKRQARVDEIMASAHNEATEIVKRAQGDAEEIVRRSQKEAGQILSRATLSADAVVAQYKPELERAQRRLSMVSTLKVDLAQQLRGAIDEVDTALDQMRQALSEIDEGDFHSTASHRESARLRAHRTGSNESALPNRQSASASDSPGARPVAAVAAGDSDDDRPRLRLAETREPEPEPEAISPPHLVIEAGPLANYSALADFEQKLARFGAITDVYVRSFHAGTAELDVRLLHPTPLASEIRSQFPEMAVDDNDPSHLRITVPAAASAG